MGHLSTGALLELVFSSGTPDVIDSLFIDGVSQPAVVWGAVGSGAQFTSSLLMGSGRLLVTTAIPEPAAIALVFVASLPLMAGKRRRRR